MVGDTTDESTLGKPTWGWPEVTLHSTGPQFGRHRMKQQRRIGAETRTPPQAETGARHQKPLCDGPRLDRWFMESDGGAPGDQVGIGPGFVQQARKVNGRCTGAKHSNPAATEVANIRMLGAMREILRP
jgi:hypothetical protein